MAPAAPAASAASAAPAAPVATSTPAPGIALLLLARIRGDAIAWGWSRFVRGTRVLRGTAGLRFARQLGSGFEGGFGLRPSASIQGLFLVFDSLEDALDFRRNAPLVQAYARRSEELFSVLGIPLRARGSWGACRPFEGATPGWAKKQYALAHRLNTVRAPGILSGGPQASLPGPGAIEAIEAIEAFGAFAPEEGPVAALTRASIRLRHLKRFWSRAPAAQQDLAQHPECLLAIGLGEAPLVRQATFSIWTSPKAMDAYARSGAHLAAIRAASGGAYFSEDMFVRFVPFAPQGCWQGRSVDLGPIAAASLAEAAAPKDHQPSDPDKLRPGRFGDTQPAAPGKRGFGAKAPIGVGGVNAPIGVVGVQAPIGVISGAEPIGAIGAKAPIGAIGVQAPIAVIGAGAGGLAAAIHLAAHGHQVTLFERQEVVGGKMRALRVDGREVPCGPTVFTMRWIFDRLFAAAGQRLEEHIQLRPLEILARHAWSGDERLDLYADPRRSTEAVAAFSGPAQARRFTDFCAEAKRIHDKLVDPFLRAQRPDLWSMMQGLGAPGLLALSGLGPFSSLWTRLGRHFPDPRLRQLFGRYATYCGTSPWLAPSTLELIAHVEMQGVWSVHGGMPALASALAAVARKLGVTIRTATAVDRIQVLGGQVRGVQLASGETVAASAVVHNGDVRALASGLHGPQAAAAHRASAKAPLSLSALIWCLHAKAEGFDLSHHNVFFQDNYRSEFDDVLCQGRLPRKPTVYLCAPERSGEAVSTTTQALDPQRPDREAMLLLVNAPAALARPIGSAVEDYREVETCQNTMLTHLHRCGLALNFAPHQSQITTPADFDARFPASGGALYGPAAHGWMATFSRAQGRSPLPGLYLAGGTVHPGPGVPMAAMSGILAAEALMADRALTRRFQPAATSGGTSMRTAMTDDMASP